MELVARKEAVIYRNFILGAGPQGIWVGYPEKTNLVFDAGALNIPRLWQGAFIDASRPGGSSAARQQDVGAQAAPRDGTWHGSNFAPPPGGSNRMLG